MSDPIPSTSSAEPHSLAEPRPPAAPVEATALSPAEPVEAAPLPPAEPVEASPSARGVPSIGSGTASPSAEPHSPAEPVEATGIVRRDPSTGSGADSARPPAEPVEAAQSTGCHAHEHGYRDNVQGLKNRLRRVEGQVRGLERMVDEDAYCIDVITQISAAKAALDRVAMLLLDDHLAHCVSDAARSGDEEFQAAKIKEVTDVVARLLK